MENIYRNHTPALTQIKMLSNLRITTTQEAVAFLRAIQPINDQIAMVLQRNSIREQHAKQAAPTPAPQPVQPTPAPVEDKTFVPEDLTSDEGFSDNEVEAKVAKLKAAKKSKKESK